MPALARLNAKKILFTLVFFTSFSLIAAVTAPPAHAASCWTGAQKLIHTESNGEQHHIVAFNVNVSVPDEKWYIAQRPSNFPLSASVWSGYYNRTQKWVGYQWPFNWWDPYSPSSWTLCYR